MSRILLFVSAKTGEKILSRGEKNCHLLISVQASPRLSTAHLVTEITTALKKGA